MLIDFCLPAKNEELILEANVKRLYDFLKVQAFAFDWRVVILINGSDDRSWLIAQDLAASDHQHFIADKSDRPGKWHALKTYFTVSQADLFVFMDADLAASLENIPDLITPLLKQEADLVMGSRHLINSKSQRKWWRHFSSNLYKNFSQLVLKHNFSDMQCGFKSFTKEMFNNLKVYLLNDNWFSDTELIMFGLKTNYRIKEIPIDWQDNRYFIRRSRTPFKNVWIFFKKTLILRRRLKKIIN